MGTERGAKRATGRARTAAKASGSAAAPPPPESTPSSARMLGAITRLIDGMDLGEDMRRRALADLAVTLAEQLDAGVGMATAAVSKELRATLADLEGEGADDDDGDPFKEWERDLSKPV